MNQSSEGHPSARTVAVVGTGRMADGIARAVARAGHDVLVLGRDVAKAADLVERIRTEEGVSLRSGARAITADVATAELVIETIAEDFEVKTQVLGAISRSVSAQTSIATNTSSLSVGALGEYVEGPERFFGLHFLNPAHETAIVEVAGGGRTSSATLDAGCEFARSIGKRPIRVERDVPGFLWNRLQFAVLREALHLLEDGVATPEDIDLAITAGLAPRWMAAGPLATADLGGVGVFAAVSEQLFPELSSATEVPARLRALARDGGTFYDWSSADRDRTLARRAEMLAAASRVIAEPEG